MPRSAHPEPVSIDPLARLAEMQTWISGHSQVRAQAAVAGTLDAVGGHTLRNALHGDWLHEPLHAVLTDIPVGAWTAAVTFDTVGAITGGTSLDRAADASIVVGLFGAVGAAITGANDWAEIKENAPRRIGTVHALLNIAGTAFFLGSFAMRRGKKAAANRSGSRALAVCGLLLVSASAHLGGNLVYEHGVGVAPRGGAAAMRRARRRGVRPDEPSPILAAI